MLEENKCEIRGVIPEVGEVELRFIFYLLNGEKSLILKMQKFDTMLCQKLPSLSSIPAAVIHDLLTECRGCTGVFEVQVYTNRYYVTS